MKLVKGAWRLIMGVKDVLVLLFLLLFFAGLYAALSLSPSTPEARDGALVLDLRGAIVEQAQSSDPVAALLGGEVPDGQYRLRDILHALKTAQTDGGVTTVVLDLDGFIGGGQVALTQIGEALDKLKAAGKPVYAFATGYSDDAYLLAAHASQIWLDPMGATLIAGPGGTRLYYKGLIDRVGANVHIYRVGKYKSFVEPYTLTKASPEARAADQALADVLWANWQSDVAKARPKAKIAAIATDPAAAVAASKGSLSQAALANGLVDKLGDRIAFGKAVGKLAGADDDGLSGNFNGTMLADYVTANPPPTKGNAIGIVTVAGAIVDGEADSGTAGGTTIANQIREGLKGGDLKALVVRIDSGGGSALASEEIRLALLEGKAKGLPIIASMGNVAASGGYWVAMAADRVFAEPSTVTGSIGVFGILPTFEKTLQSYGVTVDGVATTPLSGQPDLFGGTNATTDSLLQSGVEDFYARFLQLVAGTRKMPVEKVNEIAQGRVWDGGTARQLGLIDGFGSIDEAIAEAAKRAKLDPETVYARYLEPEPGFFEALVASFAGSAPAVRQDWFARTAAAQRRALSAAAAELQAVIMSPSVQARCLECPLPAPPRSRPGFMLQLYKKVFE